MERWETLSRLGQPTPTFCFNFVDSRVFSFTDSQYRLMCEWMMRESCFWRIIIPKIVVWSVTIIIAKNYRIGLQGNLALAGVSCFKGGEPFHQLSLVFVANEDCEDKVENRQFNEVEAISSFARNLKTWYYIATLGEMSPRVGCPAYRQMGLNVLPARINFCLSQLKQGWVSRLFLPFFSRWGSGCSENAAHVFCL